MFVFRHFLFCFVFREEVVRVSLLQRKNKRERVRAVHWLLQLSSVTAYMPGLSRGLVVSRKSPLVMMVCIYFTCLSSIFFGFQLLGEAGCSVLRQCAIIRSLSQLKR